MYILGFYLYSIYCWEEKTILGVESTTECMVASGRRAVTSSIDGWRAS